jgi:hypothetical protein
MQLFQHRVMPGNPVTLRFRYNHGIRVPSPHMNGLQPETNLRLSANFIKSFD